MTDYERAEALLASQNRIHLSLKGESWVAKYSGPKAAEIVELFGTNEIPTAYCPTMDSHEAEDRIAALNPEWIVTAEFWR